MGDSKSERGAIGMKTMRDILSAVMLLLVSVGGAMQECVAAPSMVVVSGHAGDASFESAIQKIAARWEEVARTAGVELKMVAARETDGGEGGEKSQKSRLRSALSEVSAVDIEPLWLVLSGHGSAQGRVPRFALTGEDLGADELKEMLAPIRRPVVLVLGFSCSGAFVKNLAARDRIIVSATRSGTEENWTRFGEFFSQAIKDPAADTDGDGQVSVFEAWRFACSAVDAFYKERGRLCTEHSVLEDTGLGKAFRREAFDEDGEVLDKKEAVTSSPGRRAQESVLMKSPIEVAMSAEERERRADLESELRSLRARKTELTPEAYRGSSETLFLMLDRLYDCVRRRMAP